MKTSVCADYGSLPTMSNGVVLNPQFLILDWPRRTLDTEKLKKTPMTKLALGLELRYYGRSSLILN